MHSLNLEQLNVCASVPTQLIANSTSRQLIYIFHFKRQGQTYRQIYRQRKLYKELHSLNPEQLNNHASVPTQLIANSASKQLNYIFHFKRQGQTYRQIYRRSK